MLGKGIKDICSIGYHTASDNHCAHFVSHIMGYHKSTLTCGNLTWSLKQVAKKKGLKGMTLWVDDIFRKCPEVGKWSDKKATILRETSDMTRRYALKYTVFAIGMILCSSIFAVTSLPLDEHQTMEVLFENLQVELPSSQGCVSSGTVTVGKYIQTTLAHLAHEDGSNGSSRVDHMRIELDDETNETLTDFYSDTAGFPASLRRTLSNMKKGNVLYQYSVSWGYAEDENVWSRGIQFLVRETDGSPVAGSFRCLSTP